jgi:phage replication-related protein YjqB (UPF0714/DUF867 family)
MSDRYSSFADLARHERVGVDYRCIARRAQPAWCVVAPHGGSIEPGTSELAVAIAAQNLSLYVFEGLKPTNNGDLHITSTRFDEPSCLGLIADCETVVTLHGESSDGEVQVVFLGGRDGALGVRVRRALQSSQFDVRVHPSSRLRGIEPRNLCNRGRSGAGVQLELSRGLRRTLFHSLGARGRTQPTARFAAFVGAVEQALRA